MVSVVGAPNTSAQMGIIAALKDDRFVQDYAAEFSRRNKLAHEILARIPGVRCDLPQAGFFLWIDVSALGDNREIVRQISDEEHIIVVAGDPFGPGGEGHIRIITGAMLDAEKMLDAVSRMAGLLARRAEKLGLK